MRLLKVLIRYFYYFVNMLCIKKTFIIFFYIFLFIKPEETFVAFNYNAKKNEIVCAMNNSLMRVFDITSGKCIKIWKVNSKLINKFNHKYFILLNQIKNISIIPLI